VDDLQNGPKGKLNFIILEKKLELQAISLSLTYVIFLKVAIELKIGVEKVQHLIDINVVDETINGIFFYYKHEVLK